MANFQDRDFEEDDERFRPQRRRRPEDYDDDRRHRDFGKKLSVLGLLSVIGGVLSLLVSFIPCVGSIAIFSGVVGVVLGAIGLHVASTSNQGKGLPITGIVVNLMSIGVVIIWAFVISRLGDSAKDIAKDDENVEAIAVSAAQLCKEYDTNVVKADDTYKGKVVEVTGKVKLVSRERAGRITVELGSGADTVDCDFGSAAQADLKGIDVGQSVAIRGKVKGLDRRSSYVVLENCKVVKEVAPEARANEKLPAPVVTDAAKLVKDYSTNTLKADQLYKGKYLEVKVEVQRVWNEDGKLFLSATTGGDDEFGAIDCEFPASAKGELAKLEPKDKVKVRGTCKAENGSVILTGCLLVK